MKTTSTPVVIIGAGGHAIVVEDIINIVGEYNVIGFVDEVDPHRRGEIFGGSTVLGGVDVLAELSKRGVEHAIVAIGHCASRVRVSRILLDSGFKLINAIHPSSVIASNVKMGVGCVIAAQVAVNSNSILGDNVIVNTGATVDHDCRIGPGVHICPGTHLAGHVSIGAETWIGIGSTLIDKVSIGSNCYIGAGSVVINDIPDAMLAYGVPAHIVRKV